MKKMKWVGLLLVPTMLLAACGDTTDKEKATDEVKTYKVGIDVTFPPFEYEENGKYVGIDVDLMKAIAKDQGFEIELKPMNFKGIIPAVQAKQVDIAIAGMSINKERKEVVDFTEPYFESGVSMAIKDTTKDIKSVEDLKGKTVAVKKGTVGSDYAESVKDKYGFKVTTFDTSDAMYQDVKNGRSLALFEDYPVITRAISEQEDSQLKVIGDRLQEDNYGIAVLKGENKELLKKLNAGLKNLKDNGEYDKILAKYISDGTEDEK